MVLFRESKFRIIESLKSTTKLSDQYVFITRITRMDRVISNYISERLAVVLCGRRVANAYIAHWKAGILL